MINLKRERLPSAGRSAPESARVGLANHAEALLESGNQLRHDGVAVRSVIGGIDGVGIVKVRSRVLKRNRDHAGKVVGVPRLVKLVPLSRGFLGIKIKRSVETEMVLLIHHGVAGVRIGVVSLREENDAAQIDGTAPEAGQQFALDLDPLHPLRIGRNFDRRNYLGQAELHVVARFGVQMDSLDFAVQVAGRPVELLALPLVHVGRDDVAVSAVKFGVDVEHRLHIIVPGGNFLQAAERVSERTRVDRGGFSRQQAVHVQAEERRGVSPKARLEPGFGIALPGDDDEQASGHRLRVD